MNGLRYQYYTPTNILVYLMVFRGDKNVSPHFEKWGIFNLLKINPYLGYVIGRCTFQKNNNKEIEKVYMSSLAKMVAYKNCTVVYLWQASVLGKTDVLNCELHIDIFIPLFETWYHSNRAYNFKSSHHILGATTCSTLTGTLWQNRRNLF